MKSSFIICALLVSFVYAQPHFGYHYDRNAGASGASGGIGANGASGASGAGGGIGASGASGVNSLGVFNTKETHAFFNPAPNIGSAISSLPQQRLEGATAFSGDKYLPPATTPAPPIITKQFFLVSAPEETETVPKTKHFVIGRPQKHYRVVFIKAPSPDNANIKLSAEYAPQEEKTVIYVLSKKDNELDVSDIATPAPTQPTKPEVFFIKYKTTEEASAAQKEIQDQYDQLGGTSEFLDQGVVPIKSVIGSLDGLASNGGYDYKRIQNGAQSPIKDFLHHMRYYF